MNTEPQNGMDFERSELEPVKKKQSLYNISNNYNQLMYDIEENEGEVTDEQSELLKINEAELQQKSIAYLEVIKTKEALNKVIDDEIKRLGAMKKVNTNIISRLKENLLTAVKIFGPFEVRLNKFGIRKSQSINVEDVNSLPKKYKVTKVTESADKVKLKKDIKMGKVINGVKLVNKLNLKIN